MEVGTPFAQAAGKAIQVKMEELGWAQGDDSALSEYVVLMLANGKTQDQIATDLATDLLGTEEGDPQVLEFSKWLFTELANLSQQLNGGGAAASNEPTQAIPTMGQETNGQDAEMGDAHGANDSIPTGPKAMRGGRGNRGRMLNQINRSLDRNTDSALHRVRGNQAGGRIGSHGRDQMKGHRGGRGGRHMGGFGNGSMGPGNMAQMSPDNQMQLMSMLEEQARMMSQLMPGFVPPAVNPAFQQNGPQQGRSLFDRVERQGPRRGGFSKRGGHQGQQRATGGAGTDVVMDTTMDGEQDESNTNSVCRFNVRCTRKDCPFAHQSPAAPEGTAVDVNDVCSFGAACKNRKCTGRHPSPAIKSAHQAEAMCKFFPHCTNPHCTFKHPGMPLCRNGADCKTEGCKFTHLQTVCKFNPCLNAHCAYKHTEGQRGPFPDKVWTAESAGHVSDRKFVENEDVPEELIKPETNEASQGQELAT